jgi:uracil-DNA glycosylase family 4
VDTELALPNLDALHHELINCRLCPRLTAYREQIGRVKKREFRDWDYWARPVPGFGDPAARLLVVGLAPAAHGANRTGRMFTGDSSGQWLIRAMHRFGFANRPDSLRPDDGLELKDAYLTAVVRCAPPGNRPAPAEIAACRRYLVAELRLLPNLRVVVALGRVAFAGFLTACYWPERPPRGLEFAHGARYDLGRLTLIASYHPSRQNTQTGLLTEEMLDRVFALARAELDRA